MVLPVQMNALVISYVASAAVSVVAAVIAWRRHPVPGARALALLMAAVAWWLVANSGEAASTDLGAKIAWSVLAYPGISSVPVLFLVFALRWTHLDSGLTRSRVALLFVVPAASVTLAATNDLHHLLWPTITLVDAWGKTAVYAHGPAFWMVVAYAYGVSAAALVAVAVALRRHPAYYSTRVGAVIAAACLPLLASAAYATGLGGAIHADLSSVAFALTGLLAVWATLRSRALSPVPVAWDTLFRMLSDAVLVLGPERRLAAANPAASRLLGIDATAVGRPIADVLAGLPALALAAQASGELESELRADEPATSAPGRSVHADDATASRWFNLRLSVIADARRREVGRLLVIRDVTERKRMVETIRQLSLTDELTGLLNRRGFIALAEQQIRSSMRSRVPFWLLFGDVDGLKDINDSCGHEAGDEAIREIGLLLRQHLFRDADIVARYGGDEFAILTPEAPGAATGEELVRRIETALRQREQTTDRPYPLSLSLGAVLFDPADPLTLDELVREADSRMYTRKRDRRGGREGRGSQLSAAS